MSLDAYHRTRSIVEAPKATEYRLLNQVTGELIGARDAGPGSALLLPALHRNREVWNAFMTDCLEPGNRLPADVRAGIVSLAIWVDRHTTDVVAGRKSIEALITVNRSIMEGLATENPAS